MTPGIEHEIERYLRTGDTDPHAFAWPGNVLERHRLARRDLREALIAEVERRSQSRPERTTARGLDVPALARSKLEPMVRGLFPRAEQNPVLGLLEHSVVFLTSDSIADVLLGASFASTAWDLANLYLASVDAELLGPEAPRILGLSEETTCFVSMDYFDETDPFADFVVHEAAHVFHNCKRRSIGLPATRRREWLLDIEFRKREVFAYSCEAYARILQRSRTPRERIALAEEFAKRSEFLDERADPDEVADVVGRACACTARTGWKVILAHCSPPRRSRRPTRNKPSPRGSGRPHQDSCLSTEGAPPVVSRRKPGPTAAGDACRDRSSDTRVIASPDLRINEEVDYIVRRATERSARLVRLGQLALFSTTGGDAWMIDPEDGLALPLAQSGDRLPARILETDGRFAIEWTHDYRIDGALVRVVERETGVERMIEGYPTHELASLEADP